MPGADDDPCDPNTTSMFFPSGSTAGRCAVDPRDRVCPWGVRRVRAQEDLQVVGADRNWATSRAAGTTAVLMVGGLAPDDARALLGAPVALRLDEALEPGRVFHPIFQSSQTNDPRWRDEEPGTLPGGSVGQGWVTTLDRMFFYRDGDKLMRVQCWGNPRPTHASWPRDNVAVDPGAVPGTACTPPEAIARHVEAVSFRYFGAAAEELDLADDPRGRVRRVDFEIRFLRTVTGSSREVRYAVQGSVALQNS
jgi:hypothetical protein